MNAFMELYKDRIRQLDRESLEAYALQLTEEHYSVYRSQVAHNDEQANTHMLDQLKAHER